MIRKPWLPVRATSVDVPGPEPVVAPHRFPTDLHYFRPVEACARIVSCDGMRAP
jgi:hypothetical protein